MNLILALQSLNLALRFFLELWVLAVAGYWGYKTGNMWYVKAILGIGLPLLIATIWGMFGAPKASYQLSGMSYYMLEVIIFGLPAILLLLLGKVNLAWTYGIVLAINQFFIIIWHQ